MSDTDTDQTPENAAPEPAIGLAMSIERQLPSHVTSIDWIDEARVVAACVDGTIREVRLGDGDSEDREIARHGSFASGAHWVPDLEQVVSAGYDGHLKWTALDSGEPIRDIPAHHFWSWQSVLSPDRARIASVTGRYRPGAVDYAPASESEPSVKVFDVGVGEALREFPHVPPVESVAFSRDGRYVAAGNLMGEVRVWEIDSGAEAARWATGSFTGWGIIKGHYFTGGIFALAFAPDDASLLVAGMGSTRDPAAGNGKQLWERFDWKTGQKLDAAQDGDIGQGLMETLAFHPRRPVFVMAGRLFKGDWNAAVFDAGSGARIHMENTGERISKAAFSPDGKRLALAGGVAQKRADDGSYPPWGRIRIYTVAET